MGGPKKPTAKLGRYMQTSFRKDKPAYPANAVQRPVIPLEASVKERARIG